MTALARRNALELTPSDSQLAAIRDMIDWYINRPKQQEYYLAGYAGAGKSTVAGIGVEEISTRLKKRLKVLWGAYTGKAADVLRRMHGVEADTIHRLIYKPVEGKDGKIVFKLNPESPVAEADLLVLDECSMIPEDVARDLASFKVKILVLGDPGQLPPIRGTSPFTSRSPDSFLREIHRQAQDNPIIRLATLVREGQPIPFGEYGDGVRRIRRDAEAKPYVNDNDTQVICGVHRIRWSTTRWIREERGYDSNLPLVGEKLLCCRNKHDLGLFNGTPVTLSSIVPAAKPGEIILGVKTDDGRRLDELRTRTELFREHFEGSFEKDPAFTHRDYLHFDWAYVLSCHKAQGSSWARVTVLDDSASFGDDRFRWLYTAITRSEGELTIVSRD